jgi:hypothetical protein
LVCGWKGRDPIIDQMEALWFFLAGIPAAVMLDRAIAGLGRDREAEDDGDEEGPLRPRRRSGACPGDRPGVAACGVLVVLAAPVLMAVAVALQTTQAIAVSASCWRCCFCTGTGLLEYRVPNVVTYPSTRWRWARRVFPDGV